MKTLLFLEQHKIPPLITNRLTVQNTWMSYDNVVHTQILTRLNIPKTHDEVSTGIDPDDKVAHLSLTLQLVFTLLPAHVTPEPPVVFQPLWVINHLHSVTHIKLSTITLALCHCWTRNALNRSPAELAITAWWNTGGSWAMITGRSTADFTLNTGSNATIIRENACSWVVRYWGERLVQCRHFTIPSWKTRDSCYCTWLCLLAVLKRRCNWDPWNIHLPGCSLCWTYTVRTEGVRTRGNEIWDLLKLSLL